MHFFFFPTTTIKFSRGDTQDPAFHTMASQANLSFLQKPQMADLLWWSFLWQQSKKQKEPGWVRKFSHLALTWAWAQAAAGSKALFYGPLLQADPQTNVKELSERWPPEGSNYFLPAKWQELAFNERRLTLPPSSGEVTLSSWVAVWFSLKQKYQWEKVVLSNSCRSPRMDSFVSLRRKSLPSVTATLIPFLF